MCLFLDSRSTQAFKDSQSSKPVMAYKLVKVCRSGEVTSLYYKNHIWEKGVKQINKKS